MTDSWKSPTTVIAIISLLLSLCGNIFQYHSLQIDKEKWEVERQSAIEQNNDLRERLDVFQKKEEAKKKRLDELKSEIDIIQSNIERLSKDIASANFIAQMATSTSLSPERSDQERDDAVSRSEAALDKSKELTINRERLLEQIKEKEMEYNRMLNQ